MSKNPCLKCTGAQKDKNNSVCRDCKKRIEYISLLESELNHVPSYCEIQPSPWPSALTFSRGCSSIS